jgi:hypothetical protein
MSNGERQRRFQNSNPGYDARRKGRVRSMMKAAAERYAAERLADAEAARQRAKAEAEAAAEALALPAPVLPAPNAIASVTEPSAERIAA